MRRHRDRAQEQVRAHVHQDGRAEHREKHEGFRPGGAEREQHRQQHRPGDGIDKQGNFHAVGIVVPDRGPPAREGPGNPVLRFQRLRRPVGGGQGYREKGIRGPFLPFPSAQNRGGRRGEGPQFLQGPGLLLRRQILNHHPESRRKAQASELPLHHIHTLLHGGIRREILRHVRVDRNLKGQKAADRAQGQEHGGQRQTVSDDPSGGAFHDASLLAASFSAAVRVFLFRSDQSVGSSPLDCIIPGPPAQLSEKRSSPPGEGSAPAPGGSRASAGGRPWGVLRENVFNFSFHVSVFEQDQLDLQGS